MDYKMRQRPLAVAAAVAAALAASAAAAFAAPGGAAPEAHWRLAQGPPLRGLAASPVAVRTSAASATHGGGAAGGAWAGMAGIAGLCLAATAAAGRRAARATVLRRLRIAGKEIPRNKPIAYALNCAIFGTGIKSCKHICNQVGVDPNRRTFQLSEDEELRLVDEYAKWTVENPLRRMISANIKLLKSVKHERAIRLEKGLPVRHQVTRNNAKTARILNPGRITL